LSHRSGSIWSLRILLIRSFVKCQCE
jgi:hypothetical protein